MKATEQYFPVVLFIMLYKVVLTFKSADEVLKCDHLYQRFWTGPYVELVFYHAVQGRSNFWDCGRNPEESVPFQMKLWDSAFIMLFKVVQSSFWVSGWNHKVWSFKRKLSSWVLFWGAICYAVQGCSYLSSLFHFLNEVQVWPLQLRASQQCRLFFSVMQNEN